MCCLTASVHKPSTALVSLGMIQIYLSGNESHPSELQTSSVCTHTALEAYEASLFTACAGPRAFPPRPFHTLPTLQVCGHSRSGLAQRSGGASGGICSRWPYVSRGQPRPGVCREGCHSPTFLSLPSDLPLPPHTKIRQNRGRAQCSARCLSRTEEGAAQTSAGTCTKMSTLLGET